jgi:transposase
MLGSVCSIGQSRWFGCSWSVECSGCLPVIPSNGSRADDKELYKARSEIECTFNLLKQARRFATRYEKTRRNYAAVVAIGCALLWLRI